LNRVAISELLGSVVRGPGGRRLGTIREISVDPCNGRADTVHLAVPLAAGGHGDVHIPWSQFHVRADEAGGGSPEVRLPVRLETLRRFARADF
jgi:hypothetical protein